MSCFRSARTPSILLGLAPASLTQFYAALECYRASGDQAGEGLTLFWIGVVYYGLGDYREALRYYGESLSCGAGLSDIAWLRVGRWRQVWARAQSNRDSLGQS